ncbi:App1 family protein [Luteipulveratus mongoliensis]|uniref:Phosphatidate phosphatase APP1 catalytic domain-containing protein n=1 Tax=Luteipulveratus mongoliensis TaxID=571913 RepID=A0A0K1JDL0_9MICO|nr:phosphatase domain-containing protein [Luteipulveratus mongoliensis]AKU14786.1 hypothetical protein VV02_01015 [Luteipulveratus mongoliensis]
MVKPHPAARAEDAFNAQVARRLGGRGWTHQIFPYTGYGNPRLARVLGRVALGRDGQPGTSPTADEAPVRRGIRVFFAAPVSEVAVSVTFGDATIDTVSDRGGYFDVDLKSHGLQAGWHEATITAGDVEVRAPVQIIGDDIRFGIVSDIDDTCLITMLPRPMLAAYNSFVRQETARRVVPGMAAMYRSLLAHHPGAPIVYVSTGAWNTHAVLTRFLRRHGYPAGALLLTDWGPTESSWFRSGQAHKRAQLRRLATEFPHIRWVLVGDDGQHDPQIYEDFALEHPESVECVAIRQLTPTQQVLSHGHPLSHDDVSGRPQQVPTLEGPDGYALHRLVTWTMRKARSDA